MRTCRYCGRENADQAVHCPGCGTELAFAPVNQKAQKSRDWTWIKVAFRWVGAGIFVAILYFLSLGPVTRYFVTISQSSAPTPNGFILQRTLRCPRWVAIVYTPAFALRGISQLYDRYLDWWENQQAQK